MFNNRIIFAALLFVMYLIFTFWVYFFGTEVKSEIGKMSDAAYSGKMLYQELNCNSCHQLFGLGGYLGPDLTTIYSDPLKGPRYAAAFLSYGPRQMPDFHLDSLQVYNILAFLSFVDSSASMENALITKSL